MKTTTSGTRTKTRTTFRSDDPRALIALQAESARKLDEGVKDLYEKGIILQQRKRRAEKLRGSFLVV